MKKLIAFVLCIAVICTLSVTAFAAESPSASAKVSVTLRKADSVAPTEKSDVSYTVDNGTVITVKANPDYGTFNSWSIYKEQPAATGTSAKANNSGVITLSVINLATTTKVTEAVAGTDYKIVSGSLTSAEMKVEVYTDVIICGNYNNVVTDPLIKSDSSATSPETGDFAVASAAIVMLVAAAVVFGAKKQFSK